MDVGLMPLPNTEWARGKCAEHESLSRGLFKLKLRGLSLAERIASLFGMQTCKHGVRRRILLPLALQYERCPVER